MLKNKFEQLLNDYEEAIIDMCVLEEKFHYGYYKDEAIIKRDLKEINLHISDIKAQLLSMFDSVSTPIIQ